MATLLRLIIHVYRNTVGLMLPNSCRYQPTCSQYALDALTEHGAARGAWLALKRIARCHPWAAGGYDPVSPKDGSANDDGRAPDHMTARRTNAA